MSCPETKKFSQLIDKVLDGEANAKEQETLNHHLETCVFCRSHYDQLKASMAMLNLLMTPELPIDFTKNVLEQIPVQRRRLFRRWTSKHPVLATMAVCAVPMSLVVFAVNRQAKNEKEAALIKLPGNQS
ncbi:MAG: transcriptional regulator [Sporolactobacillus sp.]